MANSALCFINFRRSDPGGHAARLVEALRQWFPPENLFFDDGSAEHGGEFPDAIGARLGQASIMLVVVGPGWLESFIMPDPKQAQDWARDEIALATALAGQSVPRRPMMIPLLMGGAKMPGGSALPPDMAAFTKLAAANVFDMGAKAFDAVFRDLLDILRRAGMPAPEFRASTGTKRWFHTLGRSLTPYFHDPSNHLEIMTAILAKQGQVALTQNFTGMGGIGKTTLALKYSHAFQGNYAGVWWFQADSAASLELDYAGLAHECGIQHEQGKTVKAVHAWLASKGSWLLVFDNAEDTGLLKKYAPERGVHHVLITSRRRDWQQLAGAGVCIRLEHWDIEQGGLMMALRLPAEVPRELRNIARSLGGLPLAMEQAGAYVQHGGTTGSKFSKWLGDMVAQSKINGMAISDDEKAVMKILSLSMKKLSPAARLLLDLCAVCSPDPIPEDLFSQHYDLLPEPLGGEWTAETWEKLVSELLNFSMIERDTARGTLTMHRLTRAVVRLIDREAEPAVEALSGLLRVEFPEDPLDEANWPQCAALLPHVRNLSQYANLPRDALVYRYSLLSDGARFLRAAPGLLEESADLFRLALRSASAVQGGGHPDVVAIKAELATLSHELGDLAAARDLWTAVLEGRKRLVGPDHPETLESMLHLAEVTAALGDLAGAREIQIQLLESNRRVHGADHSRTLATMRALAQTLLGQGNNNGAREMQAQVLERCVRSLGKEHPDTSDAAWSLHAILTKMGRANAAKAVMNEHLMWLLQTQPGALEGEQPAIRAQLAELLREQQEAMRQADSVQAESGIVNTLYAFLTGLVDALLRLLVLVRKG